MAKKKVQVLLDEQEARQIYDKVDWNWLFNFVRNCFGIGTLRRTLGTKRTSSLGLNIRM